MKKCKVIFLALLACAFGASAGTVSLDAARNAACAWVHRGKTLGARFPSEVVTKTTAHTTTNNAVFYTVKMANGGTVFMSGDTTAEPVICFTSDTGDFSTIATNSPLWALLNADMSSRCKAARPKLALATMAAAAQQTTMSANEQKWAALVAEGEALAARSQTFRTLGSGIVAVGDLRVDALVKSQWDQSNVSGLACYNYYTPQGYNKIVPGSSANAVCGCVATAMAQIMRYWEYPKTAVAQVTRTCSWNGIDMKLTTQGGTYDWEKMTLIPGAGEPEDNRKAIGKLTSDAGISVEMSYTDTSSGSGAIGSLSYEALKEVFGYKNAEFWGSNYPIDIDKAAYPQILFSNFDAGCPVLMFIYGAASGGHAIVGDGYGYNEELPYVHLNMGWSGQKDMWYNVPDIDTDKYLFTILIGVSYNIFPETEGWILSGRIVDDDGKPFAGATVTAYKAGEATSIEDTTTDENGIYSFILPAGTYDVAASSADGKLQNDLSDIELDEINSWGNDMELAEPTVRIGATLFASLDKALAAAQEGEAVEILLPTILKRPVALEAGCAIFATNKNAAASMVTRRDGALITIADGATVTMTNVVFGVAEKEKTVAVADGGVLKIGDVCGLEAVETQDADNLVVISPLQSSLFVDCAAAKSAGDTFARSTLTFAAAEPFATRLLEYDTVNLGGEARDAGGTADFQWKLDAPVPDDRAYGRLDGTNYRSLDYLFAHYDTQADAEIVILKDTTFTQFVSPKAKLVMRGEGEPKPVLTAASTSGFDIPASGSLTVSNLVFRGYDVGSGSVGKFIEVTGGELTLDNGATLDGIVGRVDYYSGVVDVKKGSVTMLPGASIINCAAFGKNSAAGYGGAICVDYNADCTLNLKGGTITNCLAKEYGGGVYVFDWYGKSGTVNVSGDLVVADNRSENAAKDDICLSTIRALPHFKLVGSLGKDSHVGVRYATSTNGHGHIDGNCTNDAFIVNAAGAVDATTLRAFFNDTDDGLTAATNANGMLVWTEKPVDYGTCEEENASTHVYYPDGTVSHYTNLTTAASYMTNGTTARIVMKKTGLKRERISGSIAFPAGCRLSLTSGDGKLYLDRVKSAGITIPAGTSLTLTNIVLTRTQADDKVGKVGNAFLIVNGGELTLADGACVSNILGNASRDAAAIVVYNGGTGTMLAGSRIVGCQNTNNYEMAFETDKNYGCGGGILVDGGTARLRGGEISGCRAVRGGGVYACNGAAVYVSGGMRIADNEWIDTEGLQDVGNVFVSDQATVYLDGALTGKIGMNGTPWATKDTNLVAEVSYAWKGDVKALSKSATNFVHDVTGDVGTVVTNDTQALIVWSRALQNGAYAYTTGGKTVTYEVADRARMIDASGRSTYYWHVEDALRLAGDNCTVEAFRNDILSSSIAVDGANITLRTGDRRAYGCQIFCATNVQISIVTNRSFTLERVDLVPQNTASTNAAPLIDVNGGKFRMTNAGIFRFRANVCSNAAAIAVHDAGELTLDEYAKINGCRNISTLAQGGGIYLDHAILFLKDCRVMENRAKCGAGVFACNGSSIRTSGRACISANVTSLDEKADAEEANLTLDATSAQVLDGEAIGFIGMALDPLGDTNLVAAVSDKWKWNAAVLTNSAASFVNDLNGDGAAAVTNKTKALIVWCGAVKDGLYKHTDGKTYAFVTGEPSGSEDEPEVTLLPEITSADEVADEVARMTGDPSVAENITTLEEYNDFRNWAQGIGVDDVAASPNAYVSYQFGAEALFEEAPTVEITEAKNTDGGLTVSVVVKDGDDPVAVASAKVKEMFEATSDVGDWSKELGLSVEDATKGTANEVKFTVTPTGNPPAAFIRLKY